MSDMMPRKRRSGPRAHTQATQPRVEGLARAQANPKPLSGPRGAP